MSHLQGDYRQGGDSLQQLIKLKRSDISTLVALAFALVSPKEVSFVLINYSDTL